MADYSDLVPAYLRPSVSDGTRLKPSITTSNYSGGTPSAANEVKPSLMYADGTLKESVADAVGLKASWLLAGSPRPPNTAPVASSVAFTGTETVGETLTRTYSYSDADGDSEGSSTTQWYRADDGSGTNEAAISGATSSTYTLVSADEGKFIRVGVTPVAATGTSPGTEAFSSYSGAIVAPSLTEVATTTVSGGAVSSISITVNLEAGKSYRFASGLYGTASALTSVIRINSDNANTDYRRGRIYSANLTGDNISQSAVPTLSLASGEEGSFMGAVGLLNSTPYFRVSGVQQTATSRNQQYGVFHVGESTVATIQAVSTSTNIANNSWLTCWRID